MSKLAILMFGAYRTFEQVAPYTKKFLLDPNPGCKLFVFCETSLSTDQLQGKLVQAFGSEVLGKVVAVASTKNDEYAAILEMLLQTKPALQPQIFARASAKDPYTWDQSYLRNSGSIIQYYQLMKCLDLMIDYERENAFRFDLVLRTRPDLCLGMPLPLGNFFNGFCSEIQDLPDSDPELYLRSLGSVVIAKAVRKPVEPNIQRCYNLNPYQPRPVSVEDFQPLLNRIQKEGLLWSLGVEQFYLARRDIFVQLRGMIYDYGAYINPMHHCTFNSESFFVYHLRRLGIKHLMLYPVDMQIYSQYPAHVQLLSLIRA